MSRKCKSPGSEFVTIDSNTIFSLVPGSARPDDVFNNDDKQSAVYRRSAQCFARWHALCRVFTKCPFGYWSSAASRLGIEGTPATSDRDGRESFLERPLSDHCSSAWPANIRHICRRCALTDSQMQSARLAHGPLQYRLAARATCSRSSFPLQCFQARHSTLILPILNAVDTTHPSSEPYVQHLHNQYLAHPFFRPILSVFGRKQSTS